MAALGGARRRPLLLLLLAGLVHGTAAVFVVKDANGTACIMANFSAAFTASYDTRSGPKNVTFDLPSDAAVLNSSSCGKENASDPSLMIAFGRGHGLILNFTRNATRYSVQLMSFIYNLSDTQIFPNASSKAIKTVESATDIRADINKKYRCVSNNQIHMHNVTVTLHDATIQAYLANNSFSKEETHCEQDGPFPTTAPPPPPHPSPSPAPENPPVYKYNVSGSNGTCLLANMGLQLNVTYEKKDNTTMTRVFSINPNKTTAGGSCGPQLVTLELRSESVSLLAFHFGMNASTSRYFLQGIQLNMTLPDARDPTFKAANSSLKALQATIGNSYKCNAEERVQVTEAFSINIFKVWVQAFQVQGDKFGSVEECQLDENGMLIPIAVGGALAGLVLIVLIAYLVGRKRSHAGYQTI
ncbi:lysosome-associated membrane glycoprotein 1 isoform X1 [Zalophus californianus]|uniref:Lysosome-associated membrane glycoprotein 1 n=2 Tax=Zalophus californianus TaxID=9704 RepID=A0A6J2CL79_ZALCA|nr:lysosome-associated membrane glycoprotein 1 isoform X1 [Zalophus californianus]